MHFSLRTLLIATTAAAIYIGGSFGILRTLADGGRVDSFGVIYLLSGVPLFVLWSFAVVWAFERRLQPGCKALLWGLVITASWHFVGPLLQMALIRLTTMGGLSQQFMFTGLGFLNAIVQAATWALLFYAFVKASESRPTPVSPWEEPETTRRGGVAKNND
jgi:hypothetical protein